MAVEALKRSGPSRERKRPSVCGVRPLPLASPVKDEASGFPPCQSRPRLRFRARSPALSGAAAAPAGHPLELALAKGRRRPWQQPVPSGQAPDFSGVFRPERWVALAPKPGCHSRAPLQSPRPVSLCSKRGLSGDRPVDKRGWIGARTDAARRCGLSTGSGWTSEISRPEGRGTARMRPPPFSPRPAVRPGRSPPRGGFARGRPGSC